MKLAAVAAFGLLFMGGQAMFAAGQDSTGASASTVKTHHVIAKHKKASKRPGNTAGKMANPNNPAR